MAKIVSGGQTWVVSSGITDNGDTVLFGGIEIVSSGGTIASTTIAGGTVEVKNGGVIGAGGVTFTSTGGELQIDATVMPTSRISGFGVGDTIDLAGVSFANGGAVQLATGNVLNVLIGGTTYSLNLD